ncbi:hypothetical protein [Bacillus pseudomycoides]|uniref:hypothetical protein n=1 Tax=Bacillus pseudomycoides TaxID=64104 RepID=UPI000A9C9755
MDFYINTNETSFLLGDESIWPRMVAVSAYFFHVRGFKTKGTGERLFILLL